MRYIPTSDARVEELKKQAKKQQRKGGGKHAELLDRVARGAGYDHWNHVVKCNKLGKEQELGPALLAECKAIVEAERSAIAKVVTMLHRPSGIGPFVLFSTGIGDAWILSPEEGLASCLMWRGEPRTLDLQETLEGLQIHWDSSYELLGEFMRVDSRDTEIGTRAVGGYPLEDVRKAIDETSSFDSKFAAVIDQEDAIDLTPQVIADLVRRGWDEAQLQDYAKEGCRYSPSRNSILTPIVSSFDDEE